MSLHDYRPFQMPDSYYDPPEDVYPCATCKAKAAAALISNALESITGDDDFPVHSTRDFLDAFGPDFAEMAECLYTAAYTEAKRQDNDYCPDHRPSKGDDE